MGNYHSINFFLSLFIRWRSLGISTPDKEDKDERFLLTVCGQIKNESLLIEAEMLILRVYGLEDYMENVYSPDRYSRISAYYKYEPKNITTIIGKT